MSESEIRRVMNIAERRKEAIYARVSSYNQKSDLDKQIEVLKSKTAGE
ncbi:MAG: hypothetical protein QXV32_06175 [Conexivisphaerales archaeon]